MTAEFVLERAHPAFVPLIEAGIRRLMQRYPGTPLHRVALFEPSSGDDCSLGNADEPGVIRMNAYWFSQEPSVLQRAAMAQPRFHGEMLEEPAHFLAHEFGHIFSDTLRRGWKERAFEVWLELTSAPARSPSAYALADPDEAFAELFAAVDLGFATRWQRSRLRKIMDRSLAESDAELRKRFVLFGDG